MVSEPHELGVGDLVECVRKDGAVIRGRFLGWTRIVGGMLARHPREVQYFLEFDNGKCVLSSYVSQVSILEQHRDKPWWRLW